MPSFIDKFKYYGKGLIVQLVPGMAAGVIIELFSEWKVDVASITRDVQNNHSLSADLKEEQKQQLAQVARQVGSLDFITSEFVINAIKKDFPAVASLFLNWGMAGKWLERQINELKEGIATMDIEHREIGRSAEGADQKVTMSVFGSKMKRKEV
jgi:hypothetical protein